MKIKELKEVREESVEKLNARVADLKKKLMKEVMPSLGKEVKNLKSGSLIRRDIAQILTIVSEKQNQEK